MTVPSLRELQLRMKAHIQPRVASEPGEVPLQLQRGTPGAERLAVYAAGYVARIEEALAEVYEAVRHIVGAGQFSALARAYAAARPSHDYNLSRTGRHLPDFLAAYPLTTRLPFLPDLAVLEWRVAEAFHAFHEPPAAAQDPAGWTDDDWARVRIHFQPSVSVVSSAWPVLDLWSARTQPRQTIDLQVTGRPQDVLVFRRDDLHVRCELLQAPQARLLSLLLQGQPLGAACAALAKTPAADALPAAQWFAAWRQAGLIVRCERAA